jgi:predicted ATPase
LAELKRKRYGGGRDVLIKAARIKTYKSFLDSGPIALTAGLNVIVGQNNVGKTALLEALALAPTDKPHRSLTTHTTSTAFVVAEPTIEAEIELTEQEALELAADSLAANVFAVGEGADESSVRMAFHPAMIVNVLRTAKSIGGSVRGLPEPTNNSRAFRIRRPALKVEAVNDNSSTPLALYLVGPLSSRIFFFHAERLNVGECRFGPNRELKSDAANLPEVLNHLQSSNPFRYDQFIELVRRVFPQVRHISVEPVDANNVRIRVWTVDPATQRFDLAPPLADCGTGIGQVLAILYVVLTAEYSRVIVIDEPQSFLHPGAVRRLFEILRDNPRHQYIVSTHSPVALATAEPETVLLVRQKEAISSVEVVSGSQHHQLAVMLSELGVRLSDVFGAERVLWVEGRTEELCFPLIVRKLVQPSMGGTVILGVVCVGDFEKRRGAKFVFDVYRRLTRAEAILPPAVGFVFDREDRKDSDIENIGRESGHAVTFLPRRMFENYLLNPKAITAVMSSLEGFDRVTLDSVNNWLAENGHDAAYFTPLKAPAVDDGFGGRWPIDVSGSKLLADLFSRLSETRVAYDKTTHGFALTKWLLEHEPDSLQELAEILSKLLQQ